MLGVIHHAGDRYAQFYYVEGSYCYAQFHGTHSKVFFMTHDRLDTLLEGQLAKKKFTWTNALV